MMGFGKNASLATNPRLAMLLAQQQRNANNGTTSGGLAHVLQQALMGYAAGKDGRDQNEAYQAMAQGMTPRQVPEEVMPEGVMGPPQPAHTEGGGYMGGVQALTGLEGNPYAGKLATQLLMKKAEEQAARDNYLFQQKNKALAPKTSADAPSNIREWQIYSRMSPEEQKNYLTMKRTNPLWNLGDQIQQRNPADPSGPPLASVQKGAPPQAKIDPKSNRVISTGPSGTSVEELPKSHEQYRAATNAFSELSNKTGLVTQDIDRALNMANGWTTGVGSMTSGVPGTPAHDLKNLLNTIKANVGFDQLAAMRASSPTGGALGQVSERENVLLQSVMGALEQSQSQEQFMGNLMRLKEVLAGRAERMRQAYEQDFGVIHENPEAARQHNQPRVVDW